MFKQVAIVKHPGAKAERIVDGYVIRDGQGRQLSYAPSSREAWRIAAYQPAK